ncbi:serine/threonine-protein kinase [Chondromyces apiculatus]|uniref:Protein kinase domain-containing protein n=1 Tax=Chondromyces apiculatus DSM 436 TaxID=1192034 RepID=A0A017TGK4_9BACT|nr:protein kinase [Chondromyces apiculatus]EYF08379.1 Hypothetical protein CAP_4995 [Chondromyces apiculatus DSM 436]
MTQALRSDDENLRDLADGRPLLVDEGTGQPVGLRLTRWLGAGGMSAVLLAERAERAEETLLLGELAPAQVAVKVLKPGMDRQLSQFNMSGADIARREVEALSAVRALRPPTEFIVGFYGSGTLSIQAFGGKPQALPWIALEHVEGGVEGATLTDRVRRAQGEGVDPVRALRLVRGMLEGVAVFHRFGVLHRDLKPDNVFVAGPLDDETPKLGDCGIARVDGLSVATLSAGTPEYGGPEQMLSALWPSDRNPLVGPWTDVHALSATIWFLIAGEAWCRSRTAWDNGERRSLRTARLLHRGWLEERALLDAVDEILARGGSPRPPGPALEVEGASRYERKARQRFASIAREDRPARFASVEELGAELLPLLEACATRWRERAAAERRPATCFRTTHLLGGDGSEGGEGGEGGQRLRARVRVKEISAPTSPGPAERVSLAPGSVSFQSGAHAFARSGDRLFFFAQSEGRMMEVPVPRELRAEVAASPWVVRGPRGGVVLVGPEHVLLLPQTSFVRGGMPGRPGEVGPIQAAFSDGQTFGVVTAETDDSNGGPELWLSDDGHTYAGPTILPLGGDVQALAPGPLGMLVVGSRRGVRGRALVLGYDQQIQVVTACVNDGPALRVAVAGVEGDYWAAGKGVVLRFDRGGAYEERLEAGAEASGEPMALVLDLQGVPWLVTERAVLRRHGGSRATWCTCYARPEGAPRLVALGFTPGGARVVDAHGGGALLQPED